jgi:cysteine desulfurase
MRPIYLDYNATTPIAPSVRAALAPFLEEQYGNPSSSYALGRAASDAMDKASEQMAALLGAQSDEIVFTSGGTESNNLAIRGVLAARAQAGCGHLIISAVEHPATIEPARYLESLGHEVTAIGVDDQGVVDPAEVAATLRPDTALVSIMHANNEIGAIQPIREIAELCRERGVPIHTDAAQSIGKIPVRVDDLQVDLLSVAGHKLYAPKGVGALYIRQGAPWVNCLMHGASQQRGLRPGTENVALSVAIGAAAELASEHLAGGSRQLSRLRDQLLQRLQQHIAGELSVNAAEAPRLPNTLSVNLPGVVGSALLARTPGVYASTGAACHSGDTKLSATLAAIGLPPEVARGTLRLSVGWPTTPAEIEQAAMLLGEAWRSLQPT